MMPPPARRRRIEILAAALVFAGALAAKCRPGADSIDVIVHTAKPYAAVVAQIETLGGAVTQRYRNVDGLAARLPREGLGALQGLAAVDGVEKDYVVALPSPRPEHPHTLALDMANRTLLGAPELAAQGIAPAIYTSYLGQVTGAEDAWADTDAGDGAIVAVIDTGTQATHVCLEGRVIAGPDLSTDAGGPLEGSTVPTNGYHGTFVAGQVAGHCAFEIFAGDPFDTHLPEEVKIPLAPGRFLVPLFGIAPATAIYAVKVFPHTGASAAISRINAAIDHVIAVKRAGEVDVDVLNMSLGGASLGDGRSLNEMLVDAATEAGITVVISAGNDGPSPTTVSRAATAYSAIAVAAASDPVHTRIFWDSFFGPGAGDTLYPSDELRIIEFSGQGPYADGRQGPDIAATGVYNFGPSTGAAGTGLTWSSGTSFSAPQVAGAAALLSAWARDHRGAVDPREIRNALLDGAAPLEGWSVQSQGRGFLNVPRSLELLRRGSNRGAPRRSDGGKLKPNIRFDPDGTFRTDVTLERGRWVDWVFEIDEDTEEIIVDVHPDGGTIPDGPSGAFGFPEAFELYVKSAKRGGIEPDFVRSANVFADASVVLRARRTILRGGIAANLAGTPPSVLEPGLMKVTLQSDWTNNTRFLSGEVTITRHQGAGGGSAGGTTATLGNDETHVFEVEVPPGTRRAIFELRWSHDWTRFPTNDLDLLFVSPSSAPSLAPFFDAATLNAPERQVIVAPEPGTWLVQVDGFQVQRGRDPYLLEVTLR